MPFVVKKFPCAVHLEEEHDSAKSKVKAISFEFIVTDKFIEDQDIK